MGMLRQLSFGSAASCRQSAIYTEDMARLSVCRAWIRRVSDFVNRNEDAAAIAEFFAKMRAEFDVSCRECNRQPNHRSQRHAKKNMQTRS